MKEMIRRNSNWRMGLLILFSAIYLIPSMLMTTLWINLQSVHVSDAPSALAARVEVSRSIYFGFYGNYNVSVREADTDTQICSVTANPFGYKGGLSGTVNKSLAWWMDGEAKVLDCKARGFHNGHFYITACHNVLFPAPYVLARRCVRSNDFRIGDE